MQKEMQAGKERFSVTSESGVENISLALVTDEAACAVYELRVKTTEGQKPVSVKWTRPMLGVLSYWSPTAGRNRFFKQWFAPNTNESRLYYGAPVYALIGQGDRNFCTVAVSDAVNYVRMTVCVNDFEEKENLDFVVRLLEDGVPEGTTEYCVRIRVDDRQIPYYETLPAVGRWWREFYPTEKDRTKSGEYPLYSTWYNYHQNPTQESLEKETEIAAGLGFKSVILDDGWSYAGRGTSDYFHCGNWEFEPTKFPDFKGFVKKLHALGMVIAVWFPVPFVGYNSPDYQTFRGKMLYNSEGFRTGILDPRYPEVRNYIVESYVRIVDKYDIDGLKLDFIDSFRCVAPDVLCENDPTGRDTESVEEGVERLLAQIRETLTARKTDFMIEFRQWYVGPAITKECNMLRVADCAFDPVTNRIGIVDLRLMDYPLAVHADMLLWSRTETPENCAKMLQNILFGVPQISVLLQRCNAEQFEIVRRYVRYWTENRDILLHGKFVAKNPELNYPFVSAEGRDKTIAAVYAETPVAYAGKALDAFNASETDAMWVEAKTACQAYVYDCFGKLLETRKLTSGAHKLSVPVGGKLEIR